MANFRLQAKQFFLTFPQNDTAKETALARIHASFPATLWIMIAQEKHQDGENHLHIGICFKERLRTRKSDYFDCIGEKHGNYQAMKSAKGTLAYLRKSDPSPLIYGDLPVDKEKHSKGDTVASMVLQGLSQVEICDAQPGYFLINKRKIEELAEWTKVKKMKESITPYPGRLAFLGQCIQTRAIVEWFNANMNVVRPMKMEQLYIWGSANSNKTSLITLLEKWFRIYWVPQDEEFYDLYNDDDYDLIVFDEFKMQKKLQWLNKFIEGAPCPVRRKGVCVTMKRKNLPVVILSNYSTESLIKDRDDWLLFNARILSIALYTPIDLDNIVGETPTQPSTPDSVPEPLVNLFCDEETSFE